MPYGPRFGRMEEPPTEEEQAAQRRRARKLELVADAAKNLQLSWEIKTRFGEDVWNVMTYDLQSRESFPGAIIIVDRDADMDIKIYASGMWFGLRTMAFINGEWATWEPHAAWLSDLADRLIEEAEQE